MVNIEFFTTVVVEERIESEGNLKSVEGFIMGEKEKALRIKMNGDQEYWVPKSLIKSESSPDSSRP